jgi:hypothetical protein
MKKSIDKGKKISCIRTIDGQEILCHISENTKWECDLELIDPLMIIYKEEGYGTTGLARYQSYSMQPISIKESFVASINEATSEAIEFYWSSLAYQREMDQYIKESIIEASEFMWNYVNGDKESIKKNILEKLSPDILAQFTSNIKN